MKLHDIMQTDQPMDRAARRRAAREGASMPPVAEEQKSAVSQQEMYDELMMTAVDILSNPKTAAPFVEILKNNEDVAAGMGNAAASLVIALDEKLAGKIPGNMVMPLAEEVLTRIAELAASLRDVSQDEVDEATQIMYERLASIYSIDMRRVPEKAGEMGDVEPTIQRQQQIAMQRQQRMSQPAPSQAPAEAM